MKDLTLYIPTCNKYLWLIKPFSFLFNRFWDESIKVVYLGYKRDVGDMFKCSDFKNKDKFNIFIGTKGDENYN